jgi:hypothetical protein
MACKCVISLPVIAVLSSVRMVFERKKSKAVSIDSEGTSASTESMKGDLIVCPLRQGTCFDDPKYDISSSDRHEHL